MFVPFTAGGMGDGPLLLAGGVGELLDSERFKCALTVFCRRIRSYRLEKNVLQNKEFPIHPCRRRILLTLLKEYEEYSVAH